MSENINVEKIMEEIRAGIVSSGADQIPLSFDDNKGKGGAASAVSLDDAVKYIAYNYEVQPYQLLTGNPIKVFIKKCIRKVAGFFFLPIVGQQNTLNQYYLYVAEAVVDQRNEIQVLKEEIARLEKQVGSSSKEDQ